MEATSNWTSNTAAMAKRTGLMTVITTKYKLQKPTIIV